MKTQFLIEVFRAAGGFGKRQREEEKLECIIFSITLPAMIATTLAIKKFENGGGTEAVCYAIRSILLAS